MWIIFWKNLPKLTFQWRRLALLIEHKLAAFCGGINTNNSDISDMHKVMADRAQDC